MKHLSGKTAVITGGASGIGRAVAVKAAAAGMNLVLADIERDALDRTAGELSAAGAQVLAVVTDVADGASVEALRDRALERFGTVHLIHNNAGIAAGGPLWTITEADWKWILGVNLWGVIHGIRIFMPLLLAQGEGHVVNTASLAGLASPQFMGPYNATKHAVVTLSETLFRDLRAVGSPVGVSVLCPGYVQTGIAESHRNRPEWAPATKGALAEQISATSRRLVSEGIDASVVADAVIDAVETNRFYIITHPESNAAVATRMKDILERRDPSELEPAPARESLENRLGVIL